MIREVTIPAVEKLHRAIALSLVKKPGKLAPEEVRFLRKRRFNKNPVKGCPIQNGSVNGLSRR